MIDQRCIELQMALIPDRADIQLLRLPDDHLPSEPIELVELIEAHEREGIIAKGQRVIEQGSGIGAAAFTLNYRGYNVVCYELHASSVEIANRLKQKFLGTGLVNPNLELEFRHGSYFPADYLKVMRQQRASGISTSEDLGAIADANHFDYLHIVPGSVTPEELQTYDIFYAYPWLVQIPSFVELFSLYARNDAVLLFKFSEWPSKMDHILRQYHLKKVGSNAFVKSD